MTHPSLFLLVCCVIILCSISIPLIVLCRPSVQYFLSSLPNVVHLYDLDDPESLLVPEINSACVPYLFFPPLFRIFPVSLCVFPPFPIHLFSFLSCPMWSIRMTLMTLYQYRLCPIFVLPPFLPYFFGKLICVPLPYSLVFVMQCRSAATALIYIYPPSLPTCFSWLHNIVKYMKQCLI